MQNKIVYTDLLGNETHFGTNYLFFDQLIKYANA